MKEYLVKKSKKLNKLFKVDSYIKSLMWEILFIQLLYSFNTL